MAKEGNPCRVAADSVSMLDHLCRPLPDRVQQFARTVVAVHESAHLVAGFDVLLAGRSDSIAGHPLRDWRALQREHRLADLEAELRVQAERAIVVRSLEQAHARDALLLRTLEHVEHQAPANPQVLDLRVDRDRADTRDHRALVEEVAPDDPTIQLGNHRVEAGVAQEWSEESTGDLGRGEVRWEAVLLGQRTKSLVTNTPACLAIAYLPRPQRHVADGSLPMHSRRCHADLLYCPQPRLRGAQYTTGSLAIPTARQRSAPHQREHLVAAA